MEVTMGNPLDALRARVAGLADAEVLEALGPDSGSYVAEALEVYRAEAARRGLEAPAPGRRGRAVVPPEVELLADGEDDADGDGVEGDHDAAGESAGLADGAAAGEFSAGDRDVECLHCGRQGFSEHTVVLATAGAPVGMPVTVLRCTHCGLLLWFAEPEG
jgi:hypothetical protein